MTRKSPVRHKVGSHKRSGKTIGIYDRGKGERTRGSPQLRQMWKQHQQTVRQEGSSRKSLEKYTVQFFYTKGRRETLHLGARDPDDALSHALKIRKYNLKPRSTYIKDGLGDVLAHISKGIGQTRAQYSRIKRSYKEGRLQVLINDAQSPNKARSVIAKAELRQKYPSIYKQIAFSRV